MTALANYGQRSEEEPASAHGYAMGHIRSILKFHSRSLWVMQSCASQFLLQIRVCHCLCHARLTHHQKGHDSTSVQAEVDCYAWPHQPFFHMQCCSGVWLPESRTFMGYQVAKLIFQRWVSVSYQNLHIVGMLHLIFSSPKGFSYCIRRRCLVHWPSMSYNLLTLLIKDTRTNHQTKPNNQHSQHPYE